MKERLFQSSKEKAESLYAKLERKIGLVNDLWEMAEALPIPEAGDSEEIIKREKNQFKAFLESVERGLPEVPPKLKKYAEIKKQIQNLKKYSLLQPPDLKETKEQTDQFEQIKQLRLNLEEILNDDDVAFIFGLRNAIKNALVVRQKIRNILKELGPITNPSSYDELLTGKYEKLRGAIIEIIPKNFSLNLIIEKTAFEKILKSTAYGLHPRHQVWNLIKEYEPETLEERLAVALFAKGGLAGFEPPRFKETLEHENFHVFIEGFKSGAFSKFKQSEILEPIEKSVKRLLGLKQAKAPDSVISDEKRLLEKKLKKIKTIADQDRVELIAEIVSVPHGSRGEQFPGHTFARDLSDFRAKLEELGKQDEDVKKIIDEIIPYVDIEEIRKKMRRLYAKVRADIPEKLRDLDIAFILLPFSKIHHIETLVERWITTKEKG